MSKQLISQYHSQLHSLKAVEIYTCQLEAEVDQRALELLGLTEEEIKIVEESVG